MEIEERKIDHVTVPKTAVRFPMTPARSSPSEMSRQASAVRFRRRSDRTKISAPQERIMKNRFLSLNEPVAPRARWLAFRFQALSWLDAFS
jgi:hypothetical protein